MVSPPQPSALSWQPFCHLAGICLRCWSTGASLQRKQPAREHTGQQEAEPLICLKLVLGLLRHPALTPSCCANLACPIPTQCPSFHCCVLWLKTLVSHLEHTHEVWCSNKIPLFLDGKDLSWKDTTNISDFTLRFPAPNLCSCFGQLQKTRSFTAAEISKAHTKHIQEKEMQTQTTFIRSKLRNQTQASC